MFMGDYVSMTSIGKIFAIILGVPAMLFATKHPSGYAVWILFGALFSMVASWILMEMSEFRNRHYWKNHQEEIALTVLKKKREEQER